MTYHVEFAEADIDGQVAESGITEDRLDEVSKLVRVQNEAADEAGPLGTIFGAVHVRLVADDDQGTVVAGPAS